jgi:hypothetical protein
MRACIRWDIALSDRGARARRGALPSELLLRRDCESPINAACLRQADELGGVWQVGRAGREISERRTLEIRRAFAKIDFRPRNIVQRPNRHGIEQ